MPSVWIKWFYPYRWINYVWSNLLFLWPYVWSKIFDPVYGIKKFWPYGWSNLLFFWPYVWSKIFNHQLLWFLICFSLGFQLDLISLDFYLVFTWFFLSRLVFTWFSWFSLHGSLTLLGSFGPHRVRSRLAS